MKKYKVAVVGATGAVGREMLKAVAERRIFRSTSSPGLQPLGGQPSQLRRERRSEGSGSGQFDFKGVDICLSSPGASVSARSRRAQQARLRRHRQHVALPHGTGRSARRAGSESASAGFRRASARIANPNCSTIQMVVKARRNRCTVSPQSGASWWRRISPSPARAARRWTSFSRRPARFL